MALSLVVYLIKRFLPFRVCPVCAGVSLTWLGILFMLDFGLISKDFLLPAGILMGGSAVGITYKLDTRIKNRKLSFWFQLFSVCILFGTVFSVISKEWKALIVYLMFYFILLLLIFYVFDSSRSGQAQGKVKKYLEECC